MPEVRVNRLRSVLVGTGALVLGACALAQGRASGEFASVERGRYLAVAADCGACHTDPADGRPFAGGLPVETPFGIVAAANITPDTETGIGKWTDAQFDAALLRGIRADGKRLYPAMPYPYYATMTLDDVHDVRAYLNTIAPVNKHVVTNRLPFPLRERVAMRVWNALYFHATEFKPDPNRSALWNRGAYLVGGAGHCAACHTPKSVLGGDKTDQNLRGYTLSGWFAPDITADAARGLARWTAADIVDYLKKGHNRFVAAAGPMAQVVVDSTSQMTEPDLLAIATYLKGLTIESVPQNPLSAQDPVMVAGAAIFVDLCSACHKSDGTGIPYLIPNLAQADSVASREPTSLLHVVLHGAPTAATADEPTAPAMPGFGQQLTDVQVAAVVTYIRNSWGHAAPATDAAQAHAARSQH